MNKEYIVSVNDVCNIIKNIKELLHILFVVKCVNGSLIFKYPYIVFKIAVSYIL